MNTVQLSRPFWLAAITLGTARSFGMEGKRKPISERDKDSHVDIVGAVGELAALSAFNATTTPGFCVPYHVDDVDLIVGTHRLDAKCIIPHEYTTRLYIDTRAVDHARARNTTGFVPVLTFVGGDAAVVADIVTPDQLVLQWPITHFQIGSKAYGMWLEGLFPRHDSAITANTHVQPGETDTIAENVRERLHDHEWPHVPTGSTFTQAVEILSGFATITPTVQKD